jgi:NAD(P)-dependent dehydrogenase (short-subunit alcohol dehydrogenase family)
VKAQMDLGYATKYLCYRREPRNRLSSCYCFRERREQKIAGDGRVFAIQADMTSHDDLHLDSAEAELRELSAVVANVGFGAGSADYALDREVCQSMLDVNLFSSVLLASVVLPRSAKTPNREPDTDLLNRRAGGTQGATPI